MTAFLLDSVQRWHGQEFVERLMHVANANFLIVARLAASQESLLLRLHVPRILIENDTLCFRDAWRSCV